ncbi:DJ-1/PfpI family protein [Hyphobacterium sp.]|uniref:DJ-1/PfpI family protein n=1 Tax=Hyphobacterium sp. TaxID=2004662 RepID=UPI003BAB1304
MNRFKRRPKTILGRIAAVTAPEFSAEGMAEATQPLEHKGFAIAVVSSKAGMLTGRTEKGQDVNLVPASTVGDMEFGDYCALILPGSSHRIEDSARAALDKFVAEGKPVIAVAEDVNLLAESLETNDISGASAVLVINGRVFAATSGETAGEAIEVFAEALAA